MSLDPVLIVILPLVGAAGVLGLSPVPRLRSHTRYVALAVVGLTTILVLLSRWASHELTPSFWQPFQVFGASLRLQNDVVMQPLAFVLALVTFSAILVTLSREEDVQPQLVAVLLALLTAAFVTLWAANPLSMIIGWAIYDLLQATGYVASGGPARVAIQNLIFSSLATLLFWSGAVLPHGGTRSGSWELVILSSAQLTLWVVAGALRLWVYPFHLAAPSELDAVPFLSVPLLMTPITGWGLWLRLTPAGSGSVPGDSWVPLLAAVTLAVGGFMAWSCKSPRSALPWIGMTVTGSVLLAAWLAEENGVAIISAGSVAWALGMAVHFLGGGLQRTSPGWSLPSLVGAVTLLGVPLTLGFVVQASLLGGAVTMGRLGWWCAFLLGNLFLVPSLLRWVRLPPHPLPSRRWLLGALGVGLGLPALLLVAAGVYPPLLIGGVPTLSMGRLLAKPGLMGWLLWVVALASGGVLAWQERNVRPAIELLLNVVHDLLRLDWLYEIVLGALERGIGILRAADEVVSGAGALLWSLLLFLLILSVWGSR